MNFISLKLNKDYTTEYQSLGFEFPDRISKSVFKRKNEFAAGRICAAKAIYKLNGSLNVFVTQNEQGLPVWPEGITGSITHTDEVVFAVVASSDEYLSIGIDAEIVKNDAHTIKSLEEQVLIDREKVLLKSNFSDNYNKNLFLIFSIKESLYKLLNPIIKQFFGFSDAEVISINYDSSAFEIKLLKNLYEEFSQGKIFTGSFQYDESNHHIFSKLSLPSTSPHMHVNF